MTAEVVADPAAPRSERAALSPQLRARRAVGLDRLRLTALPVDVVDPLDTALAGVLDKIQAAEYGVHGREWAQALRAAQNCRPLIQAAQTQAAALKRTRPDPVVVSESIWIWLVTQAELYCKLHLIHQGLALRDPDDTDDDDDTEMFDFTGHIGEEWVRQARLAEHAAVRGRDSDGYRLYRILYTNFSRLREYTRARGWVEESDGLAYMMRCARMRGLTFYVFSRHSGHHHKSPPGWYRSGRWDRVSAFGRLMLDRFYWLVAGFGYRPLRALVVNGLVILAFALIYWQFNLVCVAGTAGGAARCQGLSLPQSLYFSALAFFLAAMGEHIPRPLWGQALLVLESVWGFLNVSVVIATIINRQEGSE
jgi:hypothetical protein